MTSLRPQRENIMLAYPVDPGRINRLGATFTLQPKFKGERCRVEWFHGKPVLLSSYGNEFKYLEHITKVIEKFKGFPFDGELYKHGWSQGRINSAANRKVKVNPDSALLEYHSYDIQLPSIIQSDRLLALERIEAFITSGSTPTPLKISPSWQVTKDTWLPIASKLIKNKYEGAVLRNNNGFYSFKRSVNLLKFKPTEEDIYIITAVIEAISKTGEPKGMIGSFLVRAKDEEVSFKVGAGKLSHNERITLWKERDTLINKELKVKHELTRTEKGIPDCAVAVEVI